MYIQPICHPTKICTCKYLYKTNKCKINFRNIHGIHPTWSLNHAQGNFILNVQGINVKMWKCPWEHCHGPSLRDGRHMSKSHHVYPVVNVMWTYNKSDKIWQMWCGYVTHGCLRRVSYIRNFINRWNDWLYTYFLLFQMLQMFALSWLYTYFLLFQMLQMFALSFLHYLCTVYCSEVWYGRLYFILIY
jgi:hypothetical protein